MDYSRFMNPIAKRRRPVIIREMMNMRMKAGKDAVSLAEGAPSETLFPMLEIKTKLRDGTEVVIAGDKLKKALQYASSKGNLDLINKLKQLTQALHNPPNWSNYDLVMVSGSQDGISKVVEMVLEENDPIVLPNPVYAGAEVIFSPYNPRVIAIPQDGRGISVEALRNSLTEWRDKVRCGIEHRMPKLIYLNPTGSNPTGETISQERRQEIYRICCEFDLLILEDDPYYFLTFEGVPPPSFLSIDTEGRVVRFDSFSKIFCPGLRVGWVTANIAITNHIEVHIQNEYLQTGTLAQELINSILDEWGTDNLLVHFEFVRKYYREKCNALLQSMRKHLTGLAEWTAPSAGMFVWLKVLNINDVMDAVIPKAVERKLFVIPGNGFMVDNSDYCPYLRLSFSKATSEQLDKAVEALAEVIREVTCVRSETSDDDAEYGRDFNLPLYEDGAGKRRMSAAVG